MEELPNIKKVTKLQMLEVIRSKGYSASTSMKKDKMYEIYTRALIGRLEAPKISAKKMFAGESIKSIYPDSKQFPLSMEREDYIEALKRADFEFRILSADDIDELTTVELRKRLFRVRPDPSDVAESESDSEDEPDTFKKTAMRIVKNAKDLEAGESRQKYVAKELFLLPAEQRARFYALLKAASAKK
jgi:hypothetical protein